MVASAVGCHASSQTRTTQFTAETRARARQQNVNDLPPPSCMTGKLFTNIRSLRLTRCNYCDATKRETCESTRSKKERIYIRFIPWRISSFRYLIRYSVVSVCALYAATTICAMRPQKPQKPSSMSNAFAAILIRHLSAWRCDAPRRQLTITTAAAASHHPHQPPHITYIRAHRTQLSILLIRSALCPKRWRRDHHTCAACCMHICFH